MLLLIVTTFVLWINCYSKLLFHFNTYSNLQLITESTINKVKILETYFFSLFLSGIVPKTKIYSGDMYRQWRMFQIRHRTRRAWRYLAAGCHFFANSKSQVLGQGGTTRSIIWCEHILRRLPVNTTQFWNFNLTPSYC